MDLILSSIKLGLKVLLYDISSNCFYSNCTSGEICLSITEVFFMQYSVVGLENLTFCYFRQKSRGVVNASD